MSIDEAVSAEINAFKKDSFIAAACTAIAGSLTIGAVYSFMNDSIADTFVCAAASTWAYVGAGIGAWSAVRHYNFYKNMSNESKPQLNL